jgi:hypothetical protein
MLFAVEKPVNTLEGMQAALAEILQRVGAIDTVVASFGGMGVWMPVHKHVRAAYDA